MLLSSLGTSIANVGLPTLAQTFAASFQEVQWVVLAYLLAITTLIVSAGRLGDALGHRLLLLATLVVGPFYLSRALGLKAALVGLVMSVGPLVAALTGVPAGRFVDRLGAHLLTLVGLGGIAGGSAILFVLPARFGIPGYLAPLVVITAGYALFQTANNTADMSGLRPDQRGVISGLLNLSRNLGLITGASVMGAVFALAAGTTDIMTAPPDAVAAGMRITFAVAAGLIVIALGIAVGGRALAARVSVRGNKC